MKRYYCLVIAFIVFVSKLAAQPLPPESPGANPVPVGDQAILLLIIAIIVFFTSKNHLRKIFQKKKQVI